MLVLWVVMAREGKGIFSFIPLISSLSSGDEKKEEGGNDDVAPAAAESAQPTDTDEAVEVDVRVRRAAPDMTSVARKGRVLPIIAPPLILGGPVAGAIFIEVRCESNLAKIN